MYLPGCRSAAHSHGGLSSDWRGARSLIVAGRRSPLGCCSHSWPTSSRSATGTAIRPRADRAGFAASFADDKAIRLFYGAPHDLLTVGGYTAWRVGGILAVVMAVWAAIAAAGALSGEEQSGRSELVLSMPISRGQSVAAGLLAVVARAMVIALLLFTGLLAAGLPVTGSALLVAAVASTVPVYGAIGAAGQPARERPSPRGGAVDRGAGHDVRGPRGRRHRHRARLVAMAHPVGVGRGVRSVRAPAPGGAGATRVCRRDPIGRRRANRRTSRPRPRASGS